MNGAFSFVLTMGFFTLVTTAAAVLATRDSRRTVLVLRGLPAFFILAAIGWAQLLTWVFRGRSAAAPDHKP